MGVSTRLSIKPRNIPAVLLLLVIVGCQDGWGPDLEREVRTHCSSFSWAHKQTSSCCETYIKDRVDGTRYSQLGLAVRMDLAKAGAYQCANEPGGVLDNLS